MTAITGKVGIGFSGNDGSALHMTLNTSGNLGLGVTPSAWSLFKVMDIGPSMSLATNSVSNSDARLFCNTYYDGSYRYKNSAAASQYQMGGGVHYWYSAASGTAGDAISFTQAMTLNAAGELFVGKTSSNLATNGYEFAPAYWSAGVGQLGITGNSSSNSQNALAVYSTAGSAYRFYVSYGGNIYATNTTITAISDQRLKENIRDLDEGLATVMALKPRKFDWKEGKGQDIKNARGFIAQEFETVLPDMIETWKDPAPEGEEAYKAINANLIPSLVKAIQEQQAMIESLRQRLSAANL
jgi:hypothetical protein